MPITLSYTNANNVNEKLYIRIVLSFNDPNKVTESSHPTEEGKKIIDNIIKENSELNVVVFAPKIQTLEDYSYTPKKQGRVYSIDISQTTYTNEQVYEKLKEIQENGIVISDITIQGISGVHKYENYIITELKRKKDIDEGDGNDIEITFKEWFVSNVKTVSISKEQIEQLSRTDQDGENLNSDETKVGYVKAEQFTTEIDKNPKLKKAWTESGLLDKDEISRDDINNNAFLTDSMKSESLIIFEKINSGYETKINRKDTSTSVKNANKERPLNDQIPYTNGEEKKISSAKKKIRELIPINPNKKSNSQPPLNQWQPGSISYISKKPPVSWEKETKKR
jgi:hypothetical protein